MTVVWLIASHRDVVVTAIRSINAATVPCVVLAVYMSNPWFSGAINNDNQAQTNLLAANEITCLRRCAPFYPGGIQWLAYRQARNDARAALGDREVPSARQAPDSSTRIFLLAPCSDARGRMRFFGAADKSWLLAASC